MPSSLDLYNAAISLMPGGVNSPVRAFRAVNSTPRFIASASGSRISDVDGNSYIDYVCSWGPMILGHNHEVIRSAVEKTLRDGLSFGAPTQMEVAIAQLITSMVPNVDMVRMVNSGTEAVMSAIRLARAAANRNLIVKFDGCYHGHCDSMLVNAGSSALAGGFPSSAGVPASVANNTLIAQFNDLNSVSALFDAFPNQIAAVIVEPVAANMGVVPPQPDFLPGLRSLCDANHALLIFDEVITGFRLAPGGAQEFFGVRADIITFGKIIGGGLPVGAYCANKEVMQLVAPCGPVYQAGTLSGNPVAMAAGFAQLQFLYDNPNTYSYINSKALKLAELLRNAAQSAGAHVTVNQIASLVSPFFSPSPVSSFAHVKNCDPNLYAIYFNSMLSQGIYIAPAQFEAMFLSLAHSDLDLESTAIAAEIAFASTVAR